MDIYYCYKFAISSNPQSKANPSQKAKQPENAGKAWTREQERLLIKMYNCGASNKEMCEEFKRTETGLAARLVRLGIIESRDVFRGRK